MQKKDSLQVVVISIIIFTAILGIGFIVPLLPIFAERFGGDVFVGVLFSGFAISRAIASPIVSTLSDKYGRKFFILSGLILYSVFSIFYAHSKNAAELLVSRLLHGVASSMIIPVAFSYIGDISPRGQEGKYFSFIGASLLLGFGLGPVLGGYLADVFGEDYAFYAMAIIGIIAFVQAGLFIKESEDRAKASQSFLEIITGALKSRLTLKSSIIWLLVIIQRGALLAFLPILLDKYGYSKSSIGLSMTSYAISSSIVQYSFSPIVDKIKNKIRASFILGALASILIFPVAFISNIVSLTVITSISGSLGAVIYPLILSEISGEAKEFSRVGATIGVMEFFFSLGMIIGPIILGFIAKFFGLESVFLCSSIFLSSIFLLMLTKC